PPRTAIARFGAGAVIFLHRVVERLREVESVWLACSLQFLLETKSMHMTSTDQERWRKVRDQLRSELGEDVFSSWFGRMELETVENGSVRLSVPTRFLRNWIQSHYSEKVLLKWQSEEPDVTRLELTVRSSTIRLPPAKPKTLEPPLPTRDGRDGAFDGAGIR